MGELYRRRIENRGIIHFLIGLFPRVYKYAYFSVSRWIARMHGAEIGKGSVFPIRLARKMSRNVSIGDYTSVECLSIDDRCPVKIGSHVIISFDSKIITLSHHIDSPEWEFKHYGIEIEDYVWIASNAIIMPSCRHIGRGSVVGGGAVWWLKISPKCL